MLLIDYILLGTALLYISEFIFLRLGLQRTGKFHRNVSYEPKVSVVVAARNEEENIAECLSSLVSVEYPGERFEIIVADDGSTDNTAAVVRGFSSRHPSVKLVSAQSGTGHLRGKANALAQGIDQASGEILMFTDADCIVPRTWVRETVQCYTDPVGMVAGFTYLKSNKTFDGIQALDWFLLFGVAAATAAWNIPLTAVGNNLSVRRSAYDQVGGFRGLPFSVTEDYALVQGIWQKTGLEIRFPVDEKTLVESNPCPSWSALFRQKQRWGVGGLDMVFRGFLIMSIPFALHLLIFAGGFLVSPPVLLAAILTKVLADLFFLWKPIAVFSKYSLVKYFFTFELYYIVYELLIPFIALLSKRVVWKERAFRQK